MLTAPNKLVTPTKTHTDSQIICFCFPFNVKKPKLPLLISTGLFDFNKEELSLWVRGYSCAITGSCDIEDLANFIKTHTDSQIICFCFPFNAKKPKLPIFFMYLPVIFDLKKFHYENPNKRVGLEQS
jgi:hypothetical protein